MFMSMLILHHPKSNFVFGMHYTGISYSLFLLSYDTKVLTKETNLKKENKFPFKEIFVLCSTLYQPKYTFIF